MEQITNPPPRPRTVPAAPPPIPPAPAVAVAPVAIPVEISQGSAMGERAMGAISAARAIPEAHEPTAVRANLPGHEAEIAAIRDRIGNLMAANAVNAERIAALDPVSGEVRGQAPGFDHYMNPEDMRAEMIQQWGLGSMSEAQQDEYIDKIGEALYKSILLRVVDDIDESTSAALEAFITAQGEQVDALTCLNYLNTHIADFKQLVSEETAKLKELFVLPK